MRSALVFFATAQLFRERSLETGFENPLKILASRSSEKHVRLVFAKEDLEGPNTSRQSRASHGGNLPTLRGVDGHLSFTWYCWQGGWQIIQHPVRLLSGRSKVWNFSSSVFIWTHFGRTSESPGRTRLCIEEFLKIFVALFRQRNTCALCWPCKPARVRTLRTKLGVSRQRLATSSRSHLSPGIAEKVPVRSCRKCHPKTAEHHFVDRQ